MPHCGNLIAIELEWGRVGDELHLVGNRIEHAAGHGHDVVRFGDQHGGYEKVAEQPGDPAFTAHRSKGPVDHAFRGAAGRNKDVLELEVVIQG